MKNVVNEYKLLGALFSPENYELVYKLNKELFTDERRAILSAMQKSYIEYGSITLEGVQNHYKRELPGELFAGVVTNLEPLIDNLQVLSDRRKIKEVGDKLHLLSLQDTPDLTEAEKIWEYLPKKNDFDASLTKGSVSFLGELNQKIRGDYRFTSTGLPFLDVMMGGEWPKQDLSCVMADPGGAKTSLVCDSMLQMGYNGDASLFFSLEMSQRQLMSRWISNKLSIDNSELRMGAVDAERLGEIETAVNEINSLPLYVIDEPGLTVYNMLPIIREYVLKHGIKVVFIDYLQIIKLNSDDKNKELGEVAVQLKASAKKYDIHVCLISQKNGKDGVWGVRDSGEVPAVLDECINLVNDGTTGDVRNITIQFVKNRNGKLGDTPVMFDGRYMRFVTPYTGATRKLT